MATDQEKVANLIAGATKGARIALLRRENHDNGATCQVYLAHDCEHDKPSED